MTCCREIDIAEKGYCGSATSRSRWPEQAGRFASVSGLCCTSSRRHWAVGGTDWIVGDPRERSEKVIELSRHDAVIVST